MLRLSYTILLLLVMHSLTLGQTQTSKTPQSQTFQTVNINPGASPQKSYSAPSSTYAYPQPRQTNKGMNAQSIINQQNQRAMKAMGYTPPPTAEQIKNKPIIPSPNYYAEQHKKKMQWYDDIRATNTKTIPAKSYSAEDTKHYQTAFNEFSSALSGQSKLSIKKAVWMVENAFYNGELSYEEFDKQIQQKAILVKERMLQKGIDPGNSFAVNTVIQELYNEGIELQDPGSESIKKYKPFKYDFNDFFGKEDWSKMFVNKLLNFGTGQCHSMPLLYLIIAEELGAETFLARSPAHSYIMFRDRYDNWFNFEPTNGHYTTNSFVVSSGYVNAMTMQNRIYMQPLLHNQALVECLGDLIKGYCLRYDYDDYALHMSQYGYQQNSHSIYVLLQMSDILTVQTRKELQKIGNPSKEELKEKYPNQYKLVQSTLDVYSKIDRTGYQEIPEPVYAKWLQSAQEEARKQEHNQIFQQVEFRLK